MSSLDDTHVMDDNTPVNKVEVGGEDSRSALTRSHTDLLQASTSKTTCASDDSPVFDPMGNYLVIHKIIEDVHVSSSKTPLLLKLGSVVEKIQKSSYYFTEEVCSDYVSLKPIILDLEGLVSCGNNYCCGGSIKVEETATLTARDNKTSEEWVKVGPILDLSVEKLSQFCKPAPYGDFRKQATLIDPTVRLAMECETENFQICYDEDTASKRMKMSDSQTSRFPDFMTAIKSQISVTLADGLPVELQQHKLNLYSEGGFFKYHVDTPIDSKHMIGSLVLCLPCKHKGGDLVVQHDGNKQRFTFEDLSADHSCIQWVAFYSNCEHEVKPVEQGNRITITYNVLRKPEERLMDTTKKDCKSEKSIVSHPLIKSISEYFEKENENRLGIYLKHKYTMTGLSSDRLKGCDKELYKILSKEWDVTLYTVIGHYTCLHEKMSYDGCDEADEKWKHDVYSFTYNDYLYLTNNGPKPKQDVSDVKFIKEWSAENILVKEDESGYLGNEYDGGSYDMTYFQSALVIKER